MIRLNVILHIQRNSYFQMCIFAYYPSFHISDLFELIRTTEANFITKEEYLVFYKEISSARHMSSKTVEEMVNQAWPLISVDDKLDRKRFAAHLSLFELHSIMTIDFT